MRTPPPGLGLDSTRAMDLPGQEAFSHGSQRGALELRLMLFNPDRAR